MYINDFEVCIISVLLMKMVSVKNIDYRDCISRDIKLVQQ